MKPFNLFLQSNFQNDAWSTTSLSSPDHDIGLVRYGDKIYFIVSKAEETYLSGNVNKDFKFEFNKANSTWLKNDPEPAQIEDMLNHVYALATPTAQRLKM